MGRQYAIFLIMIIGLGLLFLRFTLFNDGSQVVTSEFPLDTTVRFKVVKDLSNGLSFVIPETFLKKIDPIGKGDSSVFVSKGKDARLIYFVDGNVFQTESTGNQLSGYFDKIGTGQHLFVKNCKTVKSQAQYIKNGSSFSGSFSLIGQMGDQQFVWRTLLAEVPVGGNQTFKNMMFVYPIALEAYYQPIGVHLAEKFGKPIR